MAKLKPFDKIEIIRKCSGLSATQKLILLIIATHLGKNEFCYPSLSTLQIECCLAKRSALTANIKSLENAGIITILSPSNGFNSNRYLINFDQIISKNYFLSYPQLPAVRSKEVVTDGHWGSDRRSLGWSPTVTRVVTDGHPKRNINKSKRNLKANPGDKNELKSQAEEALQKIRTTCRLKGH